MLGVDGRPFRTSHGTPRNATEPHGTVKLRNYDYNPEFYGFLAQPYGFLSASPLRGGFVYLSFPRWVLGVDCRTFGTPHSRNRRGWATQTENRKDEPGIRKIPDSICNFSILPFRGVPGDVPEGLPLTPTNTQRGNDK